MKLRYPEIHQSTAFRRSLHPFVCINHQTKASLKSRTDNIIPIDFSPSLTNMNPGNYCSQKEIKLTLYKLSDKMVRDYHLVRIVLYSSIKSNYLGNTNYETLA